MINQQNFGQVNGEDVTLYTIENGNKTKLSVMTYAATWQNFEVVENGETHSLIEHYDTLEGYLNDGFQVGRTVGRVAGRIGNSKFTIDNQQFHLPANEGDNLLHGGPNGIQTHNFSGEIDEKNSSVILKTTMKSSEDKFP